MNFYFRYFSFLFFFVFTGCAQSYSPNHFTTSTPPTRYEERHPINFHQEEHILDLPIKSGTSNLSNSMHKRLIDFASDYSLDRPIGKLTIFVPRGSVNSASASLLGDEVLSLLSGSSGSLSRRSIDVRSYDASKYMKPAPIRLSYHTLTPSVKDCGEWDDLADTRLNRNYRVFGCATQHNFASMIANPLDIHEPRKSTSIDAARRARVISDYRNALEPNTPERSFGSVERASFE